MLFFGSNGEFERQITKAVRAVMDDQTAKLHARLARVKDIVSLHDEIDQLKREKQRYLIEKDRRKEDHEKREREIEHKLGLHKEQVAKEIAWAKTEARLEVETANLAQSKEAFEERMEFMTESFKRENEYQRTILEKMMERLPTAEIIARLGGGGNNKE